MSDCPSCMQLRDETGVLYLQLVEAKLENVRLQQENEALIEQLDVELQSRNKEKWYE